MSSSVIDRERVVDAWLREQRERAGSPRPQYANWVSGAGDACERRLALQRLEWDKAAHPSEYLMAVFRRGNIAEREIARRQMVEAGYEFFEPVSFQIVENGEVLASGRTDGSVRDPGKGLGVVAPWEAKMINTHAWKQINTLEDMLKSKSPYMRSLPAQLMSYIYAKGENEVGVFHLMDSETWLPKFIDVPLDYAYMQEILDRFRRINDHVDRKTLPPPIDWSDDICGRCRFLHVCMPDQVRAMGTLKIWELPGTQEKIRRRQELEAQMKPLKNEFDELDKHLKGMFRHEEGSQFAVGEFLVTKTIRNVKGYTVEPREDVIVQFKGVGEKIAKGAA